MKRDAFSLPLAFPGELIINNFAGGGRQFNLFDDEENTATGSSSSYELCHQGAPA